MNNRPRSLPVVNKAVIGLAFATFVSVPMGCTVQTPEPNLAGQDVHLTVIHTADLHSRFFPYSFAPGQIDKNLGLLPKSGSTNAIVGGIARVGTVVKCIRGVYLPTDPICQGITVPGPNGEEPIAGPVAARVIHVDSGDIWEGAPVFNQFNGEVEMRAMSNLGLTAMAMGNHEFDKGSVNFEEQYQKFGGFPVLAANYMFSDPTDPTKPKLDDVIHDYTITEAGGLKIGIIGLGNLSSIQGVLQGGNSLGVRPLVAKQALQDNLRIVRPQVDVMFVISHLGLDEDEGVSAAAAEMTDQNLALGEALDTVDVVFGGHLHIVLDPPKNVANFDDTSGKLISNTILVDSGAFAKYVGRLDLIVHMPTDEEKTAGTLPAVKSYTYTLIPIEDSITADPDLENMLEPYQLAMDQYLNLSQAYGVVPCPVNDTTCPKTLRVDPNGGDSQLGNLVATSMQLHQDVQADYAVTNSLGIRTDFESGPLNLEQMYNVFPFENTITTVYLSGSETQEMFSDEAARSSQSGCRTTSQVSGIAFDNVCTYDDPDCGTYWAARGLPNGPCAKNIHIGDSQDKPCRMPDGTFNGTTCQPLSALGEYRVAVNDYIANGGSGFSVLQRNTTKFNTGISLRQSLIDYIRSLPNRCSATDYQNIVGVNCKDAQGETFDCSSTCCCHDAASGPNACGTTCAAFTNCQAMALCTNPTNGTSFDCTKSCCTHSEASGLENCDTTSAVWKSCQAQNLNPKTQSLQPTLYDFSDVACLDSTVQAHNGRINPIDNGANTGMSSSD